MATVPPSAENHIFREVATADGQTAKAFNVGSPLSS
jgi:hypothetical protein